MAVDVGTCLHKTAVPCAFRYRFGHPHNGGVGSQEVCARALYWAVASIECDDNRASVLIGRIMQGLRLLDCLCQPGCRILQHTGDRLYKNSVTTTAADREQYGLGITVTLLSLWSLAPKITADVQEWLSRLCSGGFRLWISKTLNPHVDVKHDMPLRNAFGHWDCAGFTKIEKRVNAMLGLV